MDECEYKAPIWMKPEEKDDVILWLQTELACTKEEIRQLEGPSELYDEALDNELEGI